MWIGYVRLRVCFHNMDMAQAKQIFGVAGMYSHIICCIQNQAIVEDVSWNTKTKFGQVYEVRLLVFEFRDYLHNALVPISKNAFVHSSTIWSGLNSFCQERSNELQTLRAYSGFADYS